MGNGKTVIAIVIILIGLVGLAVGVMYLTLPAHSLPSFFPGHLAGATGKHTKRGIAGLAAGAVVLIGGIVLLTTGRGRHRHRY